MAIVFIHMNGIIQQYGMQEKPLFAGTEMANAGVDVFFVISGLIMALITYGKNFNNQQARNFFIKRITRVYPIYWIYLILFLLGNSLAQGALPEMADSTGFGTLLQSITLFPSHELPILIIAWTLKFEVFFYILFTLLIALGKHAQNHYLYLFSIAVVSIGTIFDLQIPLYRQVTDPLLLEFVIGVFIGTVYLKHQHRYATFFLTFGFFLIALELVGYSPAELLNLYGTRFGRVVRFGIPAAFLVTGFLFSENWIRKFSPKILLRLGDASYSLYLSHILVLSISAKIWSLFHLNAYLHDALLGVYLLLVCLSWSLVSHRYLEQPLIRLARKYF